MSKFRHLGSKFSKTNVKFESSTFETGFLQILLRLESSYFSAQNAQIWGYELKSLKTTEKCEINKFNNRVILFSIVWCVADSLIHAKHGI